MKRGLSKVIAHGQVSTREFGRMLVRARDEYVWMLAIGNRLTIVWDTNKPVPPTPTTKEFLGL